MYGTNYKYCLLTRHNILQKIFKTIAEIFPTNHSVYIIGVRFTSIPITYSVSLIVVLHGS